VFVMTKGGPRNSSKTIVYYIYENRDVEISYACTLGLVLFLIIFGLSILNLKLGAFRNPQT
jgi:putative chitobiose transport system permease protein